MTETPIPLHSDLVPFVEPARPGLYAVLRSPLVYSVPYSASQNEHLNRLYQQKQSRVAEAVRDQDWGKIIILHERAHRLNAFLHYQDQMTDREYWSLASEVYVDTENADQNFEIWCEVVTSGRGGREHFMRPGERKAFKELPAVIPVYRGCTNSEILDLSWTVDLKVAEWFAQRFDQNGFVLEGKVCKRDVIGFLTRRGEAEIATLPDCVFDIQPLGAQRQSAKKRAMGF